MYCHSAYGLTFASALPLPELDAGRGATDATIRLAAVAADGLAGGRQIGPFLWAAPGALWLKVPGVARFLVRDGKDICIDRVAGADDNSLRLFLLGSALGALLAQRGLLVLHGNAVQMGDAAMLCLGPSGAGKSTLAAGFHRRGHAVLADDVVVVDDQGRTLPGPRRIRLWHDSLQHLGLNPGGLRRIRPGVEKFALPVTVADRAVPVRWVYILGENPGAQVLLEPVPGLGRFQPLHDNSYRPRFLEGMALKERHLQQCGQLAGRARVARLLRPKQGFSLPQMLDRLLADMADAA